MRRMKNGGRWIYKDEKREPSNTSLHLKATFFWLLGGAWLQMDWSEVFRVPNHNVETSLNIKNVNSASSVLGSTKVVLYTNLNPWLLATQLVPDPATVAPGTSLLRWNLSFISSFMGSNHALPYTMLPALLFNKINGI